MITNGHINVLVKDHDSCITGFGKHDRVVAFLPYFCADKQCIVLYCRVDHKWNLGKPTTRQILKAAKADQSIKGRFSFIRSEEHYDGRSTDVYFKKLECSK